MTQRHSDGFFSRIVITSVLVIWVGVVGGSWLGRVITEKNLAGEVPAIEVSLPEQKSKPWINKAPELQKEIDGTQKEGAHAVPDTIVVATPVAEEETSNKEDASQSQKESEVISSDSQVSSEKEVPLEGEDYSSKSAVDVAPSPIAINPAPGRDPKPTPAIAGTNMPYQLQFGSFKQKDSADNMIKRLEENNIPCVVEKIAVVDGVVYRIRGGGFDSAEKAELEMEKLKSLGFEVFLVEQ